MNNTIITYTRGTLAGNSVDGREREGTLVLLVWYGRRKG